MKSYLNQFEYVDSATAVIAKMKTIIPPVAWYIFRFTGRINFVNFWLKKIILKLSFGLQRNFSREKQLLGEFLGGEQRPKEDLKIPKRVPKILKKKLCRNLGVGEDAFMSRLRHKLGLSW